MYIYDPKYDIFCLYCYFRWPEDTIEYHAVNGIIFQSTTIPELSQVAIRSNTNTITALHARDDKVRLESSAIYDAMDGFSAMYVQLRTIPNVRM